MQWPSSRKHPRPDLANICGQAESAAQRLGRPGGKEVMEDAMAQLSKTSTPRLGQHRRNWFRRSHERSGGNPACENIRALTWPTFAARRNWQLGRLGVNGVFGGLDGPAETTAGQPGGEGSHGKCSGPALENIPAQAWLILASPATSPALHEKVMLDR